MNYLLASYLVALFLPYFVALILTPRVERWAAGRGWLDRPHGRKRHETPVPLLGGVAVFVSVAVGLLLGSLVSEPIRAGLWGSSGHADRQWDLTGPLRS